MAPPAVASFRHVSFRIGDRRILRDLCFEVYDGETACIVGESGCGKTVSLKLLAGLRTPESGEIRLFGERLDEKTLAEIRQLRMRLGFLFQGSALFDSLTVGENIAYPMKANGELNEAELIAKSKARLEEVGLTADVLGKYPSELSGGMQKRVALARALAGNPELMCYDEPTTGLDPVMTGLINDLIVRTREQHPVTSIVVTHEIRTIQRVADRVIMLTPLAQIGQGESQVIFDGSAREFFESTDHRIRRFLA